MNARMNARMNRIEGRRARRAHLRPRGSYSSRWARLPARRPLDADSEATPHLAVPTPTHKLARKGARRRSRAALVPGFLPLDCVENAAI